MKVFEFPLVDVFLLTNRIQNIPAHSLKVEMDRSDKGWFCVVHQLFSWCLKVSYDRSLDFIQATYKHIN